MYNVYQSLINLLLSLFWEKSGYIRATTTTTLLSTIPLQSKPPNFPEVSQGHQIPQLQSEDVAGGGEDDPVCLAGARDNEEMESSRAWHITNYHHSTVSPVPLFLFPSFSVFYFSSFICTPPTKYPVPLFPPLLFFQFFFCFSSSSWPTIYSPLSFLSFQSGKPLYKNCVCLGVAQITFNPPCPLSYRHFATNHPG